MKSITSVSVETNAKLVLDNDERQRSRHLGSFLQMAVPLEMDRLRHLPDDVIARIGREQITAIAERADVTMFGGAGRGATAELVRALAALALTAEGGVTFDGLHWCTDHTACERAARVAS